MAMSAEQKSKSAALHLMVTSRMGRKQAPNKQTNKQTNKPYQLIP